MCIVLAPAVAAGLAVASAVAGVAGAGIAAYGQYKSAQAQKDQAKANAKIQRNNQQVSEWQAQDATKRAGEADVESRRKYAQLRGEQVVALAGSGVDISEGSALNMLEDTNMFETIDSQRIRDNGEREAWGIRAQGANSAANANMFDAAASNYSPLTAGGSTLLTGAGDVADKWYRFQSA